MKRGKIFSLICLTLLVVALIVSGCTAKTQKVYELKYASMDNMEEPMLKVVVASWAQWLERESKGRIKITIIPSEQAAKAPDIYDAVKQGIVDIGDQYMGLVPGRFPLNEVTQLPLLFGYPAAEQTALTHMALLNKYSEMQKEFSDVKLLCYHNTNGVQIHNTKKPVQNLDDLKGLLMIALGKYDATALKLLGAVPEDIAPPEIYDALTKGVVDGIGCNYTAMKAFNFYEPLKYSTVCHISNPGRVEVMNLNTWNSLPSDLQKLFVGDNALLKARLYGHQYDIEDKKVKEWFSEQLKSKGLPGVYELPDAEKAKWVNIIQPIQQEWVKSVEAKGLPGKAILDDCIDFAKQYAYSGFDEEAEKVLHEWGAFGH